MTRRTPISRILSPAGYGRMDDHLSRLGVATKLVRYIDCGRATYAVGLLAADGVYLLPMSPPGAVGSCPTRFTLTSPCGEAVSFLWHFP